MNVTYNNGILELSDNGITVLRQPCWPDGTPWADEFQAQFWAAAHIAWLEDDTGITPEAPIGPA